VEAVARGGEQRGPIANQKEHSDSVMSMAFSSDGRRRSRRCRPGI
jgi:hypothetical protein